METKVNYIDEMKSSFLEYSLAVIMSRALPDVRDGLKPVQRRILYAMFNDGVKAAGKFSKCAGVVGEVLKHYHPHGDSAVYETLVRMIQDWVMRYPLSTGQGNFGSIDGDNAAAYRYTECKLNEYAESLMADIELNTVDFVDNYNNTKKEPTVFPAALPNLLLNGCQGIAVGMATSIPPHNVQELVTACEHGIDCLLNNKPLTNKDILKIMPGPDFPTGGIILGNEGIKDYFETGKGGIILRGHISKEDSKTGKELLIIKEIPYMVTKSKLLERIAQLVRDKKLDGLSDLRDESDASGIRVVVELKKGASAQLIEELLYKNTQLQQNLSFNMVALVDGIQPKQLGVAEIIHEFLKHRRNVVERRTRYEMDKLQSQIHLLDGQRIVLDAREEYLKKILPSASNKADLKAKVIARFEIDEDQAETVVTMANYKFTKDEWENILQNLKTLESEYKTLENILKSNKRLWEQVRKELKDAGAKYSDKRRTSIKKHFEEVETDTLIPNHAVVVSMTEDNFIKRYLWETEKVSDDKNKNRLVIVNDVPVVHNRLSYNQHNLLVCTEKGGILRMKTHEIPEMRRYGKGVATTELLKLKEGDQVIDFFSCEKYDGYLAFFSNQCRIKCIPMAQIKESNRSIQSVARLNKTEKIVQILHVPSKTKLNAVFESGGPKVIDPAKYSEWEAWSDDSIVGIATDKSPGVYVSYSKGQIYKVDEPKACRTFSPEAYIEFDHDEAIGVFSKKETLLEKDIKKLAEGKHSIGAKTFTVVRIPPIFK